MLLLGAASAVGFVPQKGIAENSAELPTLIVTVIDPADRRLGYLYHRELDSVLAALNNVGFIKVDGGVSNAGDAGVRLEAIDLKRWSRSVGGKVSGASQHLKVLLVPETQNVGVDQAALKAALETNVAGGRIYVLGPVLSGSAWSLVAGLTRPTDGGVPHNSGVEIISGSASASELLRILAPAASHDRVGVTVHSTLNLALGVRQALCDFCSSTYTFCTRDPTESSNVGGAAPDGTSRHDIALFVETSTFYGQSFIAQVTSVLNALVLPFPAGLSERLGEDPFGEKSFAQDENPSDAGPRRTELNAREARAAFDELLRALAFEDIRTVAILATDVRDRLVVLQNVRRLLPGVRVILFESDVLYSQAPDDAMRGTLVASTYPLFSENQGWTSDPDAGSRRERMVSDPSEGAYNAMSLLLEDMGRDLTDSSLRDAGPERLLEYRAPAFAADRSQKAPPVWISVLGARGSWPLTMPKVQHLQHFIEERDQTPLPYRWLRPPPTPFRGLVILTMLGAATLAAWFLLHARRVLRAPGKKDWAALTENQRSQKLRMFTWQNFVWLVVLGATSLVLAFAGLILFQSVESMGTDRILALVAFALTILLPALGVLGFTFAPRPSPPSIAWAALAPNALLAAGLVWMAVRLFGLERTRLAPFLVRATHLESGLSPVPPLLLVYIALLVSLFSVLSTMRLDPKIPFRIVKLVPKIRLRIRRGTEVRLVVAGVGLIWAWYMLGQFRPMMEVPPFAGIFRVVYAVAPITLTWTFVYVFQTAGALRGALERIASLEAWDPTFTLSGRYLVLASGDSATAEPLRPGDRFKRSFNPRVAFDRCLKTVVVIRTRLARPLFVTPLLVMGLATYPFEPRGLLLLSYGLLLAVFVAGTVFLA
ncbi:MAG TPA: hypothetical protein VFI53_20875, partial [Myxococcaceae bacterium]|nr:hypothetical protein [Myxococcaceae bacterium]